MKARSAALVLHGAVQSKGSADLGPTACPGVLLCAQRVTEVGGWGGGDLPS